MPHTDQADGRGSTPTGERNSPPDGEIGVVESEFASVAVSIDHDGNSPRLRLEDLRSGTVRHVDALELESLVWAPDGWWRRLLDPSLHRWRDPDPGPDIEALPGGPPTADRPQGDHA